MEGPDIEHRANSVGDKMGSVFVEKMIHQPLIVFYLSQYTGQQFHQLVDVKRIVYIHSFSMPVSCH